jgi:hypothetical protein
LLNGEFGCLTVSRIYHIKETLSPRFGKTRMISTSPIKLAVARLADPEGPMRAVHAAFELERARRGAGMTHLAVLGATGGCDR